MEPQSFTIDSTSADFSSTSHAEYSGRFDPNETPTVNSTNPNYHPSSLNSSSSVEKNHSASADATFDKAKGELKKGQQQVEDIITKSKRLLKQHCKSLDVSHARRKRSKFD